MHIHIQAYTSLKEISECLILRNGEVIKYHKFISAVLIELSVRCLNIGPEDRLIEDLHNVVVWCRFVLTKFIAIFESPQSIPCFNYFHFQFRGHD